MSTQKLKMVNNEQLIASDLQHIWHPCMQMKDFELCPPIIVNKAKGSYLYTNQGPLIDAQASWWCKSLGHGHPQVIAAIKKQLYQFEHVISANTTHPILVKLGEKLAKITAKQHVFFASDGSSGVEIAMKLSLHAQQLKGNAHRQEFIALENSYHGETLGTLSISDLGLYKKPYEGYGVICHFLKDIPYVLSPQDALYSDAETSWDKLLPQLEKIKSQVCAIIVEPLLQGAGGMRYYSADFLKRLHAWGQQNGIYFIADEIMTGIGRTGKWLACEHAGINPDLICLSKGLTSGSLPLSTVLIDHSIYELFYDDYEKGKSFLHSHTYSGNALALSAALATLEAMEQENTLAKVQQLEPFLLEKMQEIALLTGKLTQVRALGAMVAAELYDINFQRCDYRFYQAALKRGALLRPLAKTIYWLPPLNIDKQTIENLAEITLQSIKAL